MDRKQAAKLLGALGMKTSDHARRSSLTVVPPPSRRDITREADVIEELARLHGYDHIPTTLPLAGRSGGVNDPRLVWERKLRSMLAGIGAVSLRTPVRPDEVELWVGQRSRLHDRLVFTRTGDGGLDDPASWATARLQP